MLFKPQQSFRHLVPHILGKTKVSHWMYGPRPAFKKKLCIIQTFLTPQRLNVNNCGPPGLPHYSRAAERIFIGGGGAKTKRALMSKRALTVHMQIIIGFPGQIRKFDNQIHFNFIQIRQILSCRENYHSNSFSYHSI